MRYYADPFQMKIQTMSVNIYNVFLPVSRPNKNTILPINFIAKNDIKRWLSVSFDCFRNFWTNTRRLTNIL
jgi:hypothetical protein